MYISPQVLLVTGGFDDDVNNLDSTEFLRPGSDWQEISARLPRPMYGLRVTTVDNRVILFGEWNIYKLSLIFISPYTGPYYRWKRK